MLWKLVTNLCHNSKDCPRSKPADAYNHGKGRSAPSQQKCNACPLQWRPDRAMQLPYILSGTTEQLLHCLKMLCIAKHKLAELVARPRSCCIFNDSLEVVWSSTTSKLYILLHGIPVIVQQVCTVAMQVHHHHSDESTSLVFSCKSRANLG